MASRVSTRRLGVLERHLLTRCLGSRRLPCDCLTGLYERAGGAILRIIDATADSCRDRSHQSGTVLLDGTSSPPDAAC